MGHWLEELWRFLRYGRWGYRPQPPPVCEPSTLEAGSVQATQSDDYMVFSSQGALLHCQSTAYSKLNTAMVHKHGRLKRQYANSCREPCGLDIVWLGVHTVSETVSASGPPFSASVTVRWDYRVECN